MPVRHLLALAALLTPATARPQEADTRQVRTQAAEHMLSGRGDASLREFARAHLAPAYRESFADEDALLAHLRGVREKVAPVGGVELSLEQGRVRLHVRNRERESVVGLAFEPAPPQRITELVLESSEARPQGPTLTWETLEATLEEAVEQGFHGSVLALRGGEPVLERGFGFADPERRHPITPETLFAIGSTPIDFTHGALLALVDDELVSLDDPITLFFDDVPDDKRGITLEHLRSGRSGLIDFPGIPGVDANLDLSWIDRDEFLHRVFAAPLLFAPGTDERHSHCAWGVLAAVVEVVTDKGYEAFLRERFFEPAGMRRTGHYPLAGRFPAEQVAVGLGGNVWGEVNAPQHWGETSWLVLGSGGMVSTPGDLLRWRRFLEGGALSERSRARYGLGQPALGEGGNDRGFITTLGASGGDLVIVCSNSQVRPGDLTARLAMAAARLALGE